MVTELDHEVVTGAMDFFNLAYSKGNFVLLRVPYNEVKRNKEFQQFVNDPCQTPFYDCWDDEAEEEKR